MKNFQIVKLASIAFAVSLFVATAAQADTVNYYEANQSSHTLQINDKNNVNAASSGNFAVGTKLQLTDAEYNGLTNTQKKYLTSNGNDVYTVKTEFQIPSALRNQPVVYREKVYTLFNGYFGLTGDAAYKNSNDLYQDRGVRGEDGQLGDVTWVSTADSKFYASALSAGNQNTLSIVNAETGKVMNGLSWQFGSGENQILGDGKSGQSLGIGEETEFEWMLTSTAGKTSTKWFSNTANNVDNMIHMIVLDISDLMLKQIAEMEGWILDKDYSFNNEGILGNYIWNDEKEQWNDYYAYMMCWEDLNGTSSGCDFDYQDMVAIVSFIKPVYVTPVIREEIDEPGATPEPATLLILGLGTLGAGFAARRRMTK